MVLGGLRVVQVMVTALDEPTRAWSGPWPVGGDGAHAPRPDEHCMDVLVFPDMQRIRLVTVDQLPELAKLVGRSDWTTLQQQFVVEPVEGHYVLVCTHAARDKRCGVAGPLLLDAFDDARHGLQLLDRVHLAGTSHIGGHKFAGTYSHAI